MQNIGKREWIIILVKQPEREYHALRSMGIKPDSDIYLKSMGTIKHGDYEVLVNDLTAAEAVLFMALPRFAKDKMLQELELR